VAITDFRILRISGGRTYIEFYPVTGRTHQLRLHASSPLGLGGPIVGDFLYGSLDRRLMLNALKVTSSFCTISCKSVF
jgi:tRNA pseudouridine32 synthase/23S rRNA pseudouridine746 synthase